MRQRLGRTQSGEDASEPAPALRPVARSESGFDTRSAQMPASLPVSHRSDGEVRAPRCLEAAALSQASQAGSAKASTGNGGPQLLPDLDPSIFESLRGMLDEATIAATYRDFLLSARARIASAAALEEVEAMHRLGHSLRGTAGMLGATRVAICASKLEQDEITSYPYVLAGIAEACAGLEDALRNAKVAL